MNLSWHNTGQVLILPCLTSFSLNYCPSQKFSFLDFPLLSCDIDLTFFIWICLDIIQIKFEFYCVWPDCTRDILFCLNLVFRTFLCRFARYWHQILGMKLYWHNTEKKFTFVSFHVFFLEFSLFEFVGAGRGHVLLQQYLQYACYIL